MSSGTRTCNICSCGQGKKESIKTPNYHNEETEFLNQIVFNDSLLDSLLVYENPEQINLSDLGLRTPGLDSGFQLLNEVSDAEMIQIIQQCTVNQFLKWTPGKLNGHKVFTSDQHMKIINQEVDDNKYWDIFHVQYGKGCINISKPIFFDNGQRAFFSFNAAWKGCGGKREMNCYVKKNGKWYVDYGLKHSIICYFSTDNWNSRT
ncbi:MAG TPA: hypothetical protein VNY73_01030 [Bacteroidia bacterium]|nr:hypothetical protein [Bacteroidia bacterium]